MATGGLLALLSIGLLLLPSDARGASRGWAPSSAASRDTSGGFRSDSRQRRGPGTSDSVVPARHYLAEGGGSGLTTTLSAADKGIRSIVPIVDQSLPGTDGNVVGIARSGGTLYIAGSFRSVGENTGGLVPVDARTAEVLRPFPKVAGSVGAMLPDGSGGWYIGGEFTAVAGKPRSCLAHVLADGSVSDWSPSVAGSPGYITPPSVEALAVYGDRVYVAGGFRFINGQPRMNLGCVDLRTGAVLDWVADTPVDEYVKTFALHADTLFIGGNFSSLGGVPRSSLAAVNAATGAILPWTLDLYGWANTLMACGDTLFVGGYFTNIAGRPYAKLAAVSITASSPLPIDFRFRGDWQEYAPLLQVTALARVADTLYVVGNFSELGGQVRPGIAALDARTGTALSWAPDTTGPRWPDWPPGLCTSVAVVGPTLYVGGYFTYVGGVYHPLVAAWDRETGKVLDWTPKPDDVVAAFAAKGDTLYMGGLFRLVGDWKHRAGLAAIDLTNGRLKPWNPNPDGSVCTAVTALGDRVFVSGDFSNIGGDPQPRSFFAALDTTNGEVTDWDPASNDLATVFLVAGDTLYAGGMFTQMGGQTRNYVAAIDRVSGQVLPWDPEADWPVNTMARSGDTIFLGGTFTQMGGQSRHGIAAVDAYTGELAPWDPGTDNSAVQALLVAGNTLYVGGQFSVIGGQPRRAIAALDLGTGEPTRWYPQPTEWGTPTQVKALAMGDSMLYVGGAFGTIGGQPRICLGAVDTTTGFATDWDPGADGIVWSLAADGNTVYVGGGFNRLGGLPCSGLAAIHIPPVPPSIVISRLAMTIVPNPVRSSGSVRLEMPLAGRAALDVFDLQGRRVARILRGETLSAGMHDVPLRTDRWSEGVYFCRLQSGGATVTRKMLVVQ